ncbi:hypothetical protein DB346_16855 [Verrucomicrobia bacterium LW23]|nr:hypothetical protein DB346_16855 [Verrucomicrobia bacterium LW23]
MEKSGAPTIATVAELAGVSISTVSRALRNHPLVPARTAERIQRIAAEAGYRTNPFVSTLMSHLRMSKPIPFQASIALLDSMENPHKWKEWSVHRCFDEGARKRAVELGYHVDRIWIGEPGLTSQHLTRLLRSRGIHGVILLPLGDRNFRGREIPLDLNSFSMVTLGCKTADPHLYFASNDQFATGQLARQRLEEMGYTQVAFLTPEYVDKIVEERFLAGFLHPAGSYSHRSVSILRYGKSQPRRDLSEWLRNKKLDAVCSVLPETYRWLVELGLKIPENLGFLTLDWEPNTHGWAGVDQNHTHVAETAMNLLVQLLQSSQTGSPRHSSGVITEGVWVDGASLPVKKPAANS